MFAVFLFSVLSECLAGKKSAENRFNANVLWPGKDYNLSETVARDPISNFPGKKKETKKLKKVFNDVGLTSLTTLNNFKGSLNLLYLGIETLDGSLHDILSLCNLID